MEAQDGPAAGTERDDGSNQAPGRDDASTADEAAAPPDPQPAGEAAGQPAAETADQGGDQGGDQGPHEAAAPRGPRPVTGGIGCAALLLPLVAVAGALLCFAAGILSTVTGCTPNGSALCSANGAWAEFALPLFVSPLAAAAAAIGAVTVRRHRSTWLAVGYGIVFVGIVVGLAAASTGSN
ncbi:hypothetical protein KGA66_14925 [Actinocrinis puniceicyclus]|uniref:Uncharacterized protein n=1 Tax=Actinocrinis puniceicyclus TaxID=977794 RepID=A0A8J7WRQ9_9ACTN|nr:hypothetical protein [Actinocrinis puniceicyclus]MBS2964350.1 hypothetical protein [Actinocrinis puniceicyclus]